jgi:prepilin-type N-terminal cleavage/methylation domain-containing protein
MSVRSCLSRCGLNKNAFTLIELLLGLSILSLLALCMYNVLYNGIRIGRYGSFDNNTDRQFVSTFELLERELQNALAYDFSLQLPGHPAFIGSNNSFEFIMKSKKGLQAVKYSLKSGQAERVHQEIVGKKISKNVEVTESQSPIQWAQVLIREEMPLADYLENKGMVSSIDFEKESLVSRVAQEGFEVEYGYYTKDKVFFWKSSWVGKDIPQAVRVTLSILTDSDHKKVRTLTKEILIPTGSVHEESADGSDL